MKSFGINNFIVFHSWKLFYRIYWGKKKKLEKIQSSRTNIGYLVMAFLMALLMNDATCRGFNRALWESYTSANFRSNQQNQKPAPFLMSLTYIFRYFFHWKFTRIFQLSKYVSLEFPHFSLPLGSPRGMEQTVQTKTRTWEKESN